MSKTVCKGYQQSILVDIELNLYAQLASGPGCVIFGLNFHLLV